MKNLLFTLILLFTVTVNAQEKEYRAEREKINNLVHTKLKVNFDFNKSEMNGEAWITLTPHFYPVNKVILDAKAFKLEEIKVNNSIAAYNYSENVLTIDLDKTYKKGEEYTVYIKYIARPEEVKQKGSNVIKSAKGLYFIDPKDEDPNKPTQIWTQGETEASSCWFPTIDSPNQKTTQEIYMTVPSKFVTLSNGTLKSQTENSDGTRTDYWKMDQKHAPYLFFMGVGEFSIVKDTWNDLNVDYYVEPEYENVAKDIFGLTPEMMTFFSEITGIPYVWDKYSQIVVRDYVSGAMENTTAVVHAEDAQQQKGQLIDNNEWEETIAHELFHHWFGDLVTTESWSNLTVNESFATYSVYLWYEYKYGKDKANAHMYDDIKVYLDSQSEDKNLVRFYYEDKEHMFDPVSYHKGNAILHMLRDYLGDDAFFQGMNTYLTEHKFGTAEAHELRLAFEKVSGKDLNWFFNQWYFGNGHIKLNVTYDYNTINSSVTVNINQVGNIFKFPITIDIYEENRKLSQDVWVSSRQNSFTFPFNKLPKLINIDAKHVLLAEISDKKTLKNYIYQFNNAPHYLDRREALEEIAKHQDNKEAFSTLIKAFDDPYYEIRILALENIDLFQKYYKKEAISKIEKLAQFDKKTLVKAAALKVLGKLIEPIYTPLFTKGMNSESYAIIGSSLISLYQIDKQTTLNKVNELDDDIKEHLADAITNIYINEQDKSKLPFISNHVLKGMFLTDNKRTQQIYSEAFKWIAESDNKEAIENLTNNFVKLGLQYKKYNFDKMAVNMINQLVYAQQQSDNANKDELILILKTGMAKLIE
ncbi:MAG: M1 family metallopeptidase [Lutibacter sp.]|uniref:M1 family metallopeptidase n=1 Tax=Lutibacter sp. TaxID=1925666 RepID=UPI00181F1311|nr:M1 family metallopeptidase [Lutibacter sp.]MBT8317860.1 M1 family metallopeptidase [Lutibacter sp.]NNJ58718.1 M1 family metallopeptidase [Lutibacter sp.]